MSRRHLAFVLPILLLALLGPVERPAARAGDAEAEAAKEAKKRWKRARRAWNEAKKSKHFAPRRAALQKIAGGSHVDMRSAEEHPASAHLFIINPLSGARMDNLFSTHPATENRVRALQAMAREMGQAAGGGAGYGQPKARRGLVASAGPSSAPVVRGRRRSARLEAGPAVRRNPWDRRRS